MANLQFDWTKRVVSLENLEAMCTRISGVCHGFYVSGHSLTRVRVTYTNPDEYGARHPMTAVFPAYQSGESLAVVLDILRVEHDNWAGEGWQAFTSLLDCPELWRNPDNGKWETRDEINARQA